MAVDLDQGADPDQLGSALRHALGDPTLELYLRDDEGWLTASGPVAAPTDPSTSTVLEGEDGPLALITHDPILREDPGLVAAAVAVIRMAIENERLGQVVHDQLHEVRASRARLVAAAEDERRRIVRDLHDGAQQRLIAVRSSMQQAREAAHRIDPERLSRTVSTRPSPSCSPPSTTCVELARGIHPAILTEEGLAPAVAGLARRSPVPVQVDFQRQRSAAVGRRGDGILHRRRGADQCDAARRRASRPSCASPAATATSTSRCVTTARAGPTAHAGSGLLGMADRLDALSGSLLVDSPVGGGTRLKAVIPCA